jgi:cyclopropane fatty-acyl-phospholipid synthase-like methyltransferase
MLSLEKCIVESLDGGHEALFPYLEYILQDCMELGSDPEIMLALIQKHIHQTNLRILDLGCGKGAVAVHLASNLQCSVHGIDAMPGFIESARKYARSQSVKDKTHFEVADIRARIQSLETYDLVILGAIGHVFGDLHTTLSKLMPLLTHEGHILLDDAYVPDQSVGQYQRCHTESSFYGQIETAGFRIVAQDIFDHNKMDEADQSLLQNMKMRLDELKIKKPAKQALFDAFWHNQLYETEMLKHLLVTGTWLLQKM